VKGFRMKIFWRNFFLGIPFAIGLILTLMSIVYVVDCTNNEDSALAAIILGVIGVPILLGTTANLFKNKE